jgi:hypothetical protein
MYERVLSLPILRLPKDLEQWQTQRAKEIAKAFMPGVRQKLHGWWTYYRPPSAYWGESHDSG